MADFSGPGDGNLKGKYRTSRRALEAKNSSGIIVAMVGSVLVSSGSKETKKG